MKLPAEPWACVNTPSLFTVQRVSGKDPQPSLWLFHSGPSFISLQHSYLDQLREVRAALDQSEFFKAHEVRFCLCLGRTSQKGSLALLSGCLFWLGWHNILALTSGGTLLV